MYETYKMLGRERENELLREAERLNSGSKLDRRQQSRASDLVGRVPHGFGQRLAVTLRRALGRTARPTP